MFLDKYFGYIMYPRCCPPYAEQVDAKDLYENCHVFNQAQARAGEAIASVLDFKHKGDKNKEPIAG